MKLLAIDTSMQACSVAVFVNDDTLEIFSVYEEIERGHAERLMSMVDEALAKSGLTIKQIDRFAVCRGPGTFTGVRIGIAAARGLALACKKPLTGIGTLQVLAGRVLFEQPDLAKLAQTGQQAELCIAVDARRGEIYWQCFDLTAQPLADPLALTPQNVVAAISERGHFSILAGSGADIVGQGLADAGIAFAIAAKSLQPDATRLADIVAASGNDEFLLQQSATPLYLRPADAKIQTGYAVERQ